MEETEGGIDPNGSTAVSIWISAILTQKKAQKNVVFGIGFVNIAWNSFALFRKFCIVVSPIIISIRYHTRCYRIDLHNLKRFFFKAKRQETFEATRKNSIKLDLINIDLDRSISFYPECL
jgi:hypothetical protein